MDRQDRQNLAVFLVVVVLIGVTYWVMSTMRQQGRIEDCLMQRRRNCEQLTR